MDGDVAQGGAADSASPEPPVRPCEVVLHLHEGGDVAPLLGQCFRPVDPGADDGDGQRLWRWWQSADVDWVAAAGDLLCHPGDRVAWARLNDALDRLARRRPGRPVTGLVLSVEPGKVRADTATARIALRARSVLDAIAQQTGWRIPLFLVVVLGPADGEAAALFRHVPEETRGLPIGHRTDPDRPSKAAFEALSTALADVAQGVAHLAALAPRDRAEQAWRGIPAARTALDVATSLARNLLAPAEGSPPARLAGVYVVPAGPPDAFGLDALGRTIPADLAHAVRE